MDQESFAYGRIDGLEFESNEEFAKWIEDNTSKKMRSNPHIANLTYGNHQVLVDWEGVDWGRSDWVNGDWGMLERYLEQLIKKLAKSGQLPHGAIVSRKIESGWAQGWRLTFACRGKKVFINTVTLYWDEMLQRTGDDEDAAIEYASSELMSSITDAAIALEDLRASLGRNVCSLSFHTGFNKAVSASGKGATAAQKWIAEQLAELITEKKGHGCRCEVIWGETYNGDKCPVLHLDECYCGLFGKYGEVGYLRDVRFEELAAGDFE